MSLVSSAGQGASAANACTQLGYTVDQAAYQPPPIDQTPSIPGGGLVPGFGPEEADKIANAQAIIAAGGVAGVGRRGPIVAIATALQESRLRNLDYGDRDSLGLFQQRPSQGWGTAEQVRDPRFAALAFFGGATSPHFNPASGRASPGGLLEVGGWMDLPITVAAQSVQRSAFPGAYAKHEARATVIVDALSGGASATATPAASGAVEQSAVVTAADYGTTGVDIDAFCSSTFQLASSAGSGLALRRTAHRSGRVDGAPAVQGHLAVRQQVPPVTDFHAAVGTPIAAPTVGVVGAVWWSSGGGLTVILTHASSVATQHLHLSDALVKPGDEFQGGHVIARSGGSGVGTAPHYYYEVHVTGAPVPHDHTADVHGDPDRAGSRPGWRPGRLGLPVHEGLTAIAGPGTLSSTSHRTTSA
ncbi:MULTISPECIES: M23 family metallopeptidase [unclassified Actinotalea]|uniref:M23 family metallopeptidase n=1 Tax=unclassified Actinotalea TaxID=2638618 RepID=UPI0015F46395|nr:MULTISPECIES: M23 family metallopeptidase [unclassified Actinotalea]